MNRLLFSLAVLALLATTTSATKCDSVGLNYSINGSYISICLNGSSYSNTVKDNSVFNDNPYLNITSIYQCRFDSPCVQNITDLRGVKDNYYGAIMGDNICSYKLEIWKNISHQGEPVLGDIERHLDCMGVLHINYGLINTTHAWCADSRCISNFGIDLCNYTHSYTHYKLNSSGARLFYNETIITGYTEEYFYDWTTIKNINYATKFGKEFAYTTFNLDPNETLQLRHTFYPCHMQIGHIKKKFYEIFWRNIDNKPWKNLQESKTKNWVGLIDPWANSDYSKCKNITLPAPSCDNERQLINLTGITTPKNITIYDEYCQQGGNIVKYTRNRNGSNWTEIAFIRPDNSINYSVYYEPDYATDTSTNDILYYYDDFSTNTSSNWTREGQDFDDDYALGYNITSQSICLAPPKDSTPRIVIAYPNATIPDDVILEGSIINLGVDPGANNNNPLDGLVLNFAPNAGGDYTFFQWFLPDVYSGTNDNKIRTIVSYDWFSNYDINTTDSGLVFNNDQYYTALVKRNNGYYYGYIDGEQKNQLHNITIIGSNFGFMTSNTNGACLDNFSAWNKTAGVCQINTDLTLGSQESNTTTTSATTITIKNNITGNLNDTYVSEINPDTNYGNNEIRVNGRSNIEQWAYLTFNISDIPAGQQITDSQLCLYQYNNGARYGTQLKVNASFVTEQWNEDTLTWNTRPATNATLTSINIPNTGINVYRCWNVTNGTKWAYNDGWSNVSFQLSANIGLAAEDLVYFIPREHGDVTQQPYLNVTYGTATPYTAYASARDVFVDITNGSGWVLLDANVTGGYANITISYNNFSLTNATLNWTTVSNALGNYTFNVSVSKSSIENSTHTFTFTFLFNGSGITDTKTVTVKTKPREHPYLFFYDAGDLYGKQYQAATPWSSWHTTFSSSSDMAAKAYLYWDAWSQTYLDNATNQLLNLNTSTPVCSYCAAGSYLHVQGPYPPAEAGYLLNILAAWDAIRSNVSAVNRSKIDYRVMRRCANTYHQAINRSEGVSYVDFHGDVVPMLGVCGVVMYYYVNDSMESDWGLSVTPQTLIDYATTSFFDYDSVTGGGNAYGNSIRDEVYDDFGKFIPRGYRHYNYDAENAWYIAYNRFYGDTLFSDYPETRVSFLDQIYSFLPNGAQTQLKEGGEAVYDAIYALMPVLNSSDQRICKAQHELVNSETTFNVDGYTRYSYAITTANVDTRYYLYPSLGNYSSISSKYPQMNQLNDKSSHIQTFSSGFGVNQSWILLNTWNETVEGGRIGGHGDQGGIVRYALGTAFGDSGEIKYRKLGYGATYAINHNVLLWSESGGSKLLGVSKGAANTVYSPAQVSVLVSDPDVGYAGADYFVGRLRGTEENDTAAVTVSDKWSRWVLATKDYHVVGDRLNRSTYIANSMPLSSEVRQNTTIYTNSSTFTLDASTTEVTRTVYIPSLKGSYGGFTSRVTTNSGSEEVSVYVNDHFIGTLDVAGSFADDSAKLYIESFNQSFLVAGADNNITLNTTGGVDVDFLYVSLVDVGRVYGNLSFGGVDSNWTTTGYKSPGNSVESDFMRWNRTTLYGERVITDVFFSPRRNFSAQRVWARVFTVVSKGDVDVPVAQASFNQSSGVFLGVHAYNDYFDGDSGLSYNSISLASGSALNLSNGSWRDTVWYLNGSLSSIGGLETDAVSGMARVVAGDVDRFLLVSGSVLNYSGSRVFSSNESVDYALIEYHNSSQFNVSVESIQSVNVSLHNLSASSWNVSYSNGTDVVDEGLLDGNTSIWWKSISGDLSFVVTTGEAATSTTTTIASSGYAGNRGSDWNSIVAIGGATFITAYLYLRRRKKIRGSI